MSSGSVRGTLILVMVCLLTVGGFARTLDVNLSGRPVVNLDSPPGELLLVQAVFRYASLSQTQA